jgi:hypothetical protein
MTEHDIDTRAYVRTSAQVFVFGARCMMPHQASQWVMSPRSSVAGSAPWGELGPILLNYEPEIEYFRYHLSGEHAWVMYPRAENNGNNLLANTCSMCQGKHHASSPTTASVWKASNILSMHRFMCV